MPTTKTVTIYQFFELSETAKDAAVNWWLSSADYETQQVFDDTVEDAKNVGLIIETLSDHKANKGYFKTCAMDCAKRILQDHGKNCETFKTATAFFDNAEKLGEANKALDAHEIDNMAEKEELSHEFLQSLLEDYRIMYNSDCECRTSREYAEEEIIANEYTFTEIGERENA